MVQVQQKKWLNRFLLFFLAIYLLALSLDLRLSEIMRPLWDDEYHQNYEILRAQGFFELRQNIWDQYQPILDYLLRKVFWFPILGSSELSLRIPSLFYSIATVMLSFFGTMAVLGRAGFSFYWRIFFGFLIGLYTVNHIQEVSYSVEARLYSFLSLASLSWYFYLMLADLRKVRALTVISLTFAQVHFFALPQIGFLYAVLAVKNRKQARSYLLGLAIIVLLTVALNFPAFQGFLQYGTKKEATLLSGDFLSRMVSSVKSFAHYLRLPIPYWLLILFCFWSGAKAIKKIQFQDGVLFLMSVVFPVLLLSVYSFKSSVPFHERYFMAFYGMGISLLLLVARICKGQLKIPENYQKWVSVLVVIALLLVFRVPSCFKNTQVFTRLKKLEMNFSDEYRTAVAFDLYSDTRPMLLIHDFGGTDHQPLYYFQFVLTRSQRFNQGALEILKLVRSAVREKDASYREQIENKITSFLKQYPQGLVALSIGVEGVCNALEKEFPVDVHLRAINLLHPSGCAWVIEGARNVVEVLQISKALGKSIFITQ